ncbi:hypothetical protein BLNAU_18940 [Blattamonas nauphoetae]|uniref:Uncharacterized protein n=1 Tax=Blattamonas nauphoetae TaxID=2049346 RepID=A0ABQ9X3B5_9EUKA|nr:hypothetical protein BLNAU_18940 [Blattamonas nauphoetae]
MVSPSDSPAARAGTNTKRIRGPEVCILLIELFLKDHPQYTSRAHCSLPSPSRSLRLCQQQQNQDDTEGHRHVEESKKTFAIRASSCDNDAVNANPDTESAAEGAGKLLHGSLATWLSSSLFAVFQVITESVNVTHFSQPNSINMQAFSSSSPLSLLGLNVFIHFPILFVDVISW